MPCLQVHPGIHGFIEGHPDLNHVPDDISDPEQQVEAWGYFHGAKF